MSLSKEAILHIGDQAIDANRDRNAGLPDHSVALPSNYELHDLQLFQPHRRRFRGKLQTNNIEDFNDYVTTHSLGGQSGGFIDPENLSCTVFFNLGNEQLPGHADWRATLTLKATPAYAALKSIDGYPLGQKALTDWLEDWQGNVSPFSGSEGAPYGTLGKAIQAIRDITLKGSAEKSSKVGDFEASRTAIEEIEARSKHELPTGFEFTCEPFLDLPERTFTLRLSVRTSDDTPTLVCRVMQKEVHDEGIARDFKEKLSEALDEHVVLTIGTFTP